MHFVKERKREKKIRRIGRHIITIEKAVIVTDLTIIDAVYWVFPSSQVGCTDAGYAYFTEMDAFPASAYNVMLNAARVVHLLPFVH